MTISKDFIDVAEPDTRFEIGNIVNVKYPIDEFGANLPKGNYEITGINGTPNKMGSYETKGPLGEGVRVSQGLLDTYAHPSVMPQTAIGPKIQTKQLA